MSDQFGKISIQQPASPELPPVPKRSSPKKRSPSSRKSIRERPEPRRGMSLVWFLVLVLFFTLYNVAGFVGVPYYLTTVLPKTIYQKTGFIFQARAVQFNPLTFVFSVENSKLLSADDALPDLLKIKSVTGKLKPLSLLRYDLVCDGLRIDELEAHITRNGDGSYIFSALFSPPGQNNPAEMMDFSDLPFQFSLNNISVSKSKIIFSDLPQKKRHRIENIELALPTFSNFPFQAGNYIRPHFSATINGSPLKLTGRAGVGEKGDEKPGTDLSCDINDLNLPLYLSYIPFKLPFNIARGKADGKIGLTFTPENKKGEKLAITFDLQIQDTVLSTHSNSITIGAPAANLAGTLLPVSKHIHLKTISIREPEISSYGKNFTENIRTLFIDDSKPEELKRSLPPIAVDMDLVIVDSGVLKLFDKSESTNPQTSWNSIQFSLKDYTSAVRTEKNQVSGSFRLTGDQQGEPSTFSWQGPLTGSKLLEGSLSINNIQTSVLFQTFGINPLANSKGLADLKGKLRLNLAGNAHPSPLYSLTEAKVSIQNFTLQEQKSTILSAPILTLSQFSTSDEQTDFGDITIDNGTLNVTRGELPNAFSLFKQKKYQLHSLSFEGKATLLTNQHNNSKLHFPEVGLIATDLNLAEKTKNNISINMQGADGGSLKTEGSVALTPFQATLKTEFSKLQASAVFSWFTTLPLLTEMTGLIGGKGNLTLPKIGFVGRLELDETALTEEKEPIISWETSTFQDINFSAEPFHLGIVSAEIVSPSFSWTITADDNSPLENFKNVLQKQLPFSSKEKQTKKNITISSFDVQEIIITNGRIQVKEERLSPAWQGSITDLSGTISDLHSAKTSVESQFRLSGKLDDSPFSVEGASDFFSQTNNGRFTFTLTDFPIADFHDQLAPLLDIDTSKGTFQIKQDSQWKDDRLSTSGTIAFSGIEPESQTSDTMLALALLTDSENTFSLEFSSTAQEPVSGAILFDDLVTRFNKLIVKASVSPLLVAAGGFTDLIGNEFAEFKAGEAVMSEKGLETVTRYAALLSANPNIGLAISGHSDRVLDAAAMKMKLQEEETARVAAENKNRYRKWQEQKRAYSKMFEQKGAKTLREGKIVEQDIPPKFLQDFIPMQPQQITVNEAMLDELAENRVSEVYHYFTNQLDLSPERISIIESKQPAAEAENQSKNVSIAITPL